MKSHGSLVPLNALLPRAEKHARRPVWTSRRNVSAYGYFFFSVTMRMDEEQSVDNAPGICWRSGSGSAIWDPVVLTNPPLLPRSLTILILDDGALPGRAPQSDPPSI
jgi:hypothetical protein